MNKRDEVREIGKDEMNLVEFPITLLSKRHSSSSKILKFSDTILGENNKPIKKESGRLQDRKNTDFHWR